MKLSSQDDTALRNTTFVVKQGREMSGRRHNPTLLKGLIQDRFLVTIRTECARSLFQSTQPINDEVVERDTDISEHSKVTSYSHLTTLQPENRVISGFWRRLFAHFLDWILLWILGYIIGSLFFDFFAQMGNYGCVVGFCVCLAYFGDHIQYPKKWLGIRGLPTLCNSK